MFRTLYRRLLIVILAFGLAMTAIFAVILLVYHEAYHTEADQTVNRRLAQQYANARLLVTDGPLTVRNFHAGIDKLAELNPDVDIYLVDRAGGIVASSVPEASWMRSRIDLQPIASFLDENASLPIFGDDPRSTAGREIFSAAPVQIEDCPARYLYVILHRNSAESAVRQLRQSYTINESLGLLVSCGLLAVGATVILLRAITRRLSRLKSDMETFEAATLTGDGRGPPQSFAAEGDEIERLAAMFGALSSRVKEQMEALRETDDLRRDMVANISHDLRTPLTTLQVHLDTLLLKDAELSEPDRRRYLATARDQCQRLARLVTQLLELAKLDAGQVQLDAEPFQLADLLQDIAQKFALRASQRGVHLTVEHPDGLPLVVADISLIERAIDNLVENALQHSPAGTAVALRAEPAGPGHVRIEVRDSGPGIAAADQARIFDRFYRGDSSRPGGPAHAGLGLAIVKGVLDLHGVGVSVRSQPGAGARFAFELPTHQAQSA